MRKKERARGPSRFGRTGPGGETCWSRGKIPPCQRAMAQTQAVSSHRTDRRRPGFESRTSQTCFFVWRIPLNHFFLSLFGRSQPGSGAVAGIFFFPRAAGGAAAPAPGPGDGRGSGGRECGARAAGGAGAGRGARGGGRARLAPRGASACIQGGSDTGPRARRGAGRPRLRRRGRAGRSRGGTGSPPPRTAKCTGARRCCRRAARTNS